ncbi:DNA polymerase III subunit psi [Hafnia paralvei]|uniref:DNA polymerase III subunit psi n=1 Tax=Hafnia paralvei TaxID=546367 RepID=UPI0038CFFD85
MMVMLAVTNRTVFHPSVLLCSILESFLLMPEQILLLNCIGIDRYPTAQPLASWLLNDHPLQTRPECSRRRPTW